MNIRPAPRDVFQAIVRWCDCGCNFTLATVLNTEDSTPCKAGARAIIDARGSVIYGTVGGGAAEAEAQRRAIEALKTGRPVVFDINLCGDALGSSDPICGGTMRMLLDPTAAQHRAAFAAADSARQSRRRGVFVTTIGGETEACVAVQFCAEEAISAHLGFPDAPRMCAVLKREEPRLFVAEPTTGQRLEVLVEPLTAPPLLVIAGGGHIGQALAAQARLVGFDIIVVDDRPEFADPRLFPEGTTTVCGKMDEQINRVPTDGDAYVVIVTRGHRHDAEALTACLCNPAAYIGMIGSRHKVALMRQELIASGRATAAEFDRVYAPVGLDIGAVTVPEIAASITAQLIAVRRKGAASRKP